MFRTFLATTSVAALLATGAFAQTPTPAPTAPAPAPTQMQTPAPAARTAAPAVHLSANEFSVNKLIGISIYAPKPDNAAAARPDPSTTASTPRPADPATTASGAARPDPSTTASTARTGAIAPTPTSDEQWRAMRGQHDSIGKIDDLIIGADGRITHAVIGVGGFLGIGEKKVALELREVKLMRQSDGTIFGVVMRTKQQLQDMPTFMGERT
jgi:hypothetical protein